MRDRTNQVISKELLDSIIVGTLRTMTGDNRLIPMVTLRIVMGFELIQMTITEVVIKNLPKINSSSNEQMLNTFSCPYTKDQWAAMNMPTDRTSRQFPFDKNTGLVCKPETTGMTAKM